MKLTRFFEELKSSKSRDKYKPLHGTFINVEAKNSTRTIKRLEKNSKELNRFLKCYGKEIIIKEIN